MPKILRYNLDWKSLELITSFELISLMFLMYSSIVLRSKVDTTLLVVITNSLWSAQIKSAIKFLSSPLMLAICLLDRTINLLKLIEFMRTITYFFNRPFVIILILCFSFFYLFMTLYICSTFLLDKFGMFSLILTMSLMLLLEASVYKQLPLAKISDKDILLL